MFLCSGPWKPLRGHKSLEDHPTLPLAMWGHELFEAGGGGGVRVAVPSASSASDTADLFHVRRNVLSITLPGGIVFTSILKLTIFVSEMA